MTNNLKEIYKNIVKGNEELPKTMQAIEEKVGNKRLERYIKRR